MSQAELIIYRSDDEQALSEVSTRQPGMHAISLENALSAIEELKRELIAKAEATELFGQLRGDGQDTLLSGWHANLIILQGRNCVLMAHDATRFPVFIPCLKKADFAHLDHRFIDIFMNTLLKAGATDAQMQIGHNALAPLVLDSQCDRSVQGTMNQMAQDLGHRL